MGVKNRLLSKAPGNPNTETESEEEASIELPPVQEGLFSSEDLYSYGGATPVITWYVEGGDLGGTPH